MAITQKKTASGRVNFGKIGDIADTPDLLAIQLQSCQDFLQLEKTPDNRNKYGFFNFSYDKKSIDTKNFP
jgi:DNA-directed RNA polymerase subunit beta